MVTFVRKKIRVIQYMTYMNEVSENWINTKVSSVYISVG